jgi:O-antigen ligase
VTELRVRGADATSVLTVALGLLLLLPSALIFAPLGPAGAPAAVLLVFGLVWWANMQVLRGKPGLSPNRPARRAMTIYGMVILGSYVSAMMRPINAIETRAADRGVFEICALAGAFLLAAEGVQSRQRFDDLLRRLVLLGGVIATIGAVEFFTGINVVKYLQIPGFSYSTGEGTQFSRNGLIRPASTATHPIEFGVVMALLLPIALHYAIHAQEHRRLHRIAAGLIAFAAIASLSRSACVGLAVGLLITMASWPGSRRKWLLLALPFLALGVKLAAPGVLGTLFGLFTQASSDSSVQSRTNSYSAVAPYIKENPIFGRGFGTFLPSYRILDNQYLGTLIETGVIGLICLLGLFACASWAARKAGRLQAQGASRELAYAVYGATVAAGLSFATFDAFGFAKVAVLSFFLMGCCWALYRGFPDDPEQQTSGSESVLASVGVSPTP